MRYHLTSFSPSFTSLFPSLMTLDECALGTSQCQQRCIDGLNPVNNYTCGCYNGFKVDPSNRLACLGPHAVPLFLVIDAFFHLTLLTICIDINECTELTQTGQPMHACSDLCSNGLSPYGSYTCGCDTGKVLLKPSDRICVAVTSTPTSPPTSSICGNNIRESGEECEVNVLGCTSECKCMAEFPSDGNGTCVITQPQLR